jgi:hypothetical protein
MQEYRVVMNCMRGGDFREGIRALLVDRDNSPKWEPSTLEGVSEAKIGAYFESLGEHDLDVFALNKAPGASGAAGEGAK